MSALNYDENCYVTWDFGRELMKLTTMCIYGCHGMGSESKRPVDSCLDHLDSVHTVHTFVKFVHIIRGTPEPISYEGCSPTVQASIDDKAQNLLAKNKTSHCVSKK